MAQAGHSLRTKNKKRLRASQRRSGSRGSLVARPIVKPPRPVEVDEERGFLLSIPDELLVEVLSYLTATELSQTRRVCQKVKLLIDKSPALWANATFCNIWPTTKSSWIFERAAENNNIECLFKLGLSHLYCYNLDASMRRSAVKSQFHGSEAATALVKADNILYPQLPCTWVLIRPPWARGVALNCCVKECVYSSLKEKLAHEKKPSDALRYNVGVVGSLSKKDVSGSSKLLMAATENDCPHALYETYRAFQESDTGSGDSLQFHRHLRKAALLGNTCAELELACLYAAGEFKDSSEVEACKFLTQWTRNSKTSGNHFIELRQPFLLNAMRQILIDWLVEASAMKDLPSSILHVAVSCLDSYLLLRPVERTKLQLVGIACFLLAAKFDSDEDSIITIRESAWLTDNTYQYEDVVKMIGEILGALKGNISRLTAFQYSTFILKLFPKDQQRDHLAHYLLDFSLHFTDFGIYKHSLIAASSVFLANMILDRSPIWTDRAAAFTGFGFASLLDCVWVMYRECALRFPKAGDTNSPFKGVADRYSGELFARVAFTHVIGPGEFVSRLEMMYPGLHAIVKCDGIQFVLSDGTGTSTSQPHTTMLLKSKQLTNFNNSGYEGDLDDNSDFDESFINCSCREMDADRSTTSVKGLEVDRMDNCCGSSNADPSDRQLTCSPSLNELGQMGHVDASSKKGPTGRGIVRSPLKLLNNSGLPNVSGHMSQRRMAPSGCLESPNKRSKF